ncbi:MAG: Fe-Mn family superoxide dismutase [Myxococcales bacterium]|nr:Fe-Mn family superoxide dismutase [Myxococcales bacterium]
MKRYEPKQFPRLKGLSGISDGLLQDHLKLYEGYVKNTNELNSQLEGLLKDGKAKGTNPAFAEMTRRLGFEYCGMVLHELYFSNLVAEPDPLNKSGALAQAAIDGFGSIEAWLDDLKAIAAMRGVGWAMCYQNPENKAISNHWIELHNDGHPPGFKPIVVMDCWEHAWVPDYKVTERAKYIEAYFRNLDYRACEARLIK